MKKLISMFYLIFNTATAMIVNKIYGSIGWAIVSWFFSPIAWIVMLIKQDVNLTIIKSTFNFFLK